MFKYLESNFLEFVLISLKCVSISSVDHRLSLIRTMAWRLIYSKPSPKQMMSSPAMQKIRKLVWGNRLIPVRHQAITSAGDNSFNEKWKYISKCHQQKVGYFVVEHWDMRQLFSSWHNFDCRYLFQNNLTDIRLAKCFYIWFDECVINLMHGFTNYTFHEIWSNPTFCA